MSLFDTISNMLSKYSSHNNDNYCNYLIESMKGLESELDEFLVSNDEYIPTHSYSSLVASCTNVEQEVEKEIRSHRLIKGFSYYSLKAAYEHFQESQHSFFQKVQDHNNRLLKQETDKAYQIIGNVEGQKLDFQQMECIVKNAHSHLVIAGAGTGKTTTILGKVKYLLAAGQVKPQELLILSFTNAAASEMKNRLLKETSQKIYVATFHKLGYDIIRFTEKKTPKICQNDIRSFALEDIRKLLQDKEYQKLIMRYLLFNQVEAKSEFAFSDAGEYQDYLETNPPLTILQERVKSYGEMQIANFLTQHGIRYEYEAAYPIDTRTQEYGQYHPDFYLPEYDIYLEYFGIDRNGNAPSYFSGKEGKTATQTYQEGIQWKRRLHQENGTTLIECYAFEHLEGFLLSKLQERLEAAGITLKECSLKDLFELSGQNAKNVFSSLADIMATVISLCKNRKISSEELLEKTLRENKNQLLLARLITPVYKDYEKYLHDNSLVDFTDMLIRAEDLTISGQFAHKFRYVIVDEYQDISSAQYRLLKAMRDQFDYELFCVGDDWQSIYRFAGSDIGYILNFAHYWKDPEISRIETTYRFSQRLIDISGQFVMENPHQIKKYIHSGNNKEQLVLGHIHGFTDINAIQFLAKKLEELPKNSTVFLIGRYQFDIDLLKKNEAFSLKFDNENQINRVFFKPRSDLQISFYTAHRSKGLQADYVFIINNRRTNMGFPSKVQNPPLVEMLLEQADQYPDAEERRLYYVALTRARKRVYLVTTGNNISLFAQNLIERYSEEIKAEAWSCPLCGGQLKRVSGPYGDFYGCSNYKINGCKFKRKIISGQ